MSHMEATPQQPQQGDSVATTKATRERRKRIRRSNAIEIPHPNSTQVVPSHQPPVTSDVITGALTDFSPAVHHQNESETFELERLSSDGTSHDMMHDVGIPRNQTRGRNTRYTKQSNVNTTNSQDHLTNDMSIPGSLASLTDSQPSTVQGSLSSLTDTSQQQAPTPSNIFQYLGEDPIMSRRRQRRQEADRMRPRSYYENDSPGLSTAPSSTDPIPGVQHSQSASYVPQQFDGVMLKHRKYPSRTGSQDEVGGGLARKPFSHILQRGSWDGSKSSAPMSTQRGRDHSLDTSMPRRGETLPAGLTPSDTTRWSRDSSMESLSSTPVVRSSTASLLAYSPRRAKPFTATDTTGAVVTTTGSTRNVSQTIPESSEPSFVAPWRQKQRPSSQTFEPTMSIFEPTMTTAEQEHRHPSFTSSSKANVTPEDILHNLKPAVEQTLSKQRTGSMEESNASVPSIFAPRTDSNISKVTHREDNCQPYHGMPIVTPTLEENTASKFQQPQTFLTPEMSKPKPRNSNPESLFSRDFAKKPMLIKSSSFDDRPRVKEIYCNSPDLDELVEANLEAAALDSPVVTVPYGNYPMHPNKQPAKEITSVSNMARSQAFQPKTGPYFQSDSTITKPIAMDTKKPVAMDTKKRFQATAARREEFQRARSLPESYEPPAETQSMSQTAQGFSQKSLLEPPTEEKESLSDFEKHLLELKAELKAPPKKKNTRTYKGIDSEQSMNIKSLMGIPVVMPQGETIDLELEGPTMDDKEVIEALKGNKPALAELLEKDREEPNKPTYYDDALAEQIAIAKQKESKKKHLLYKLGVIRKELSSRIGSLESRVSKPLLKSKSLGEETFLKRLEAADLKNKKQEVKSQSLDKSQSTKKLESTQSNQNLNQSQQSKHIESMQPKQSMDNQNISSSLYQEENRIPVIVTASNSQVPVQSRPFSPPVSIVSRQTPVTEPHRSYSTPISTPKQQRPKVEQSYTTNDNTVLTTRPGSTPITSGPKSISRPFSPEMGTSYLPAKALASQPAYQPSTAQAESNFQYKKTEQFLPTNTKSDPAAIIVSTIENAISEYINTPQLSRNTVPVSSYSSTTTPAYPAIPSSQMHEPTYTASSVIHNRVISPPITTAQQVVTTTTNSTSIAQSVPAVSVTSSSMVTHPVSANTIMDTSGKHENETQHGALSLVKAIQSRLKNKEKHVGSTVISPSIKRPDLSPNRPDLSTQSTQRPDLSPHRPDLKTQTTVSNLNRQDSGLSPSIFEQTSRRPDVSPHRTDILSHSTQSPSDPAQRQDIISSHQPVSPDSPKDISRYSPRTVSPHTYPYTRTGVDQKQAESVANNRNNLSPRLSARTNNFSHYQPHTTQRTDFGVKFPQTSDIKIDTVVQNSVESDKPATVVTHKEDTNTISVPRVKQETSPSRRRMLPQTPPQEQQPQPLPEFGISYTRADPSQFRPEYNTNTNESVTLVEVPKTTRDISIRHSPRRVTDFKQQSENIFQFPPTEEQVLPQTQVLQQQTVTEIEQQREEDEQRRIELYREDSFARETSPEYSPIPLPKDSVIMRNKFHCIERRDSTSDDSDVTVSSVHSSRSQRLSPRTMRKTAQAQKIRASQSRGSTSSGVGAEFLSIPGTPNSHTKDGHSRSVRGVQRGSTSSLPATNHNRGSREHVWSTPPGSPQHHPDQHHHWRGGSGSAGRLQERTVSNEAVGASGVTDNIPISDNSSTAGSKKSEGRRHFRSKKDKDSHKQQAQLSEVHPTKHTPTQESFQHGPHRSRYDTHQKQNDIKVTSEPLQDKVPVIELKSEPVVEVVEFKPAFHVVPVVENIQYKPVAETVSKTEQYKPVRETVSTIEPYKPVAETVSKTEQYKPVTETVTKTVIKPVENQVPATHKTVEPVGLVQKPEILTENSKQTGRDKVLSNQVLNQQQGSQQPVISQSPGISYNKQVGIGVTPSANQNFTSKPISKQLSTSKQPVSNYADSIAKQPQHKTDNLNQSVPKIVDTKTGLKTETLSSKPLVGKPDSNKLTSSQKGVPNIAPIAKYDLGKVPSKPAISSKTAGDSESDQELKGNREELDSAIQTLDALTKELEDRQKDAEVLNLTKNDEQNVTPKRPLSQHVTDVNDALSVLNASHDLKSPVNRLGGNRTGQRPSPLSISHSSGHQKAPPSEILSPPIVIETKKVPEPVATTTTQQVPSQPATGKKTTGSPRARAGIGAGLLQRAQEQQQQEQAIAGYEIRKQSSLEKPSSIRKQFSFDASSKGGSQQKAAQQVEKQVSLDSGDTHSPGKHVITKEVSVDNQNQIIDSHNQLIEEGDNQKKQIADLDQKQVQHQMQTGATSKHQTVVLNSVPAKQTSVQSQSATQHVTTTKQPGSIQSKQPQQQQNFQSSELGKAAHQSNIESQVSRQQPQTQTIQSQVLRQHQQNQNAQSQVSKQQQQNQTAQSQVSKQLQQNQTAQSQVLKQLPQNQTIQSQLPVKQQQNQTAQSNGTNQQPAVLQPQPISKQQTHVQQKTTSQIQQAKPVVTSSVQPKPVATSTVQTKSVTASSNEAKPVSTSVQKPKVGAVQATNQSRAHSNTTTPAIKQTQTANNLNKQAPPVNKQKSQPVAIQPESVSKTNQQQQIGGRASTNIKQQTAEGLKQPQQQGQTLKGVTSSPKQISPSRQSQLNKQQPAAANKQLGVSRPSPTRQQQPGSPNRQTQASPTRKQPSPVRKQPSPGKQQPSPTRRLPSPTNSNQKQVTSQQQQGKQQAASISKPSTTIQSNTQPPGIKNKQPSPIKQLTQTVKKQSDIQQGQQPVALQVSSTAAQAKNEASKPAPEQNKIENNKAPDSVQASTPAIPSTTNQTAISIEAKTTNQQDDRAKLPLETHFPAHEQKVTSSIVHQVEAGPTKQVSTPVVKIPQDVSDNKEPTSPTPSSSLKDSSTVITEQSPVPKTDKGTMVVAAAIAENRENSTMVGAALNRLQRRRSSESPTRDHLTKKKFEIKSGHRDVGTLAKKFGGSLDPSDASSDQSRDRSPISPVPSPIPPLQKVDMVISEKADPSVRPRRTPERTMSMREEKRSTPEKDEVLQRRSSASFRDGDVKRRKPRQVGPATDRQMDDELQKILNRRSNYLEDWEQQLASSEGESQTSADKSVADFEARLAQKKKKSQEEQDDLAARGYVVDKELSCVLEARRRDTDSESDSQTTKQRKQSLETTKQEHKIPPTNTTTTKQETTTTVTPILKKTSSFEIEIYPTTSQQPIVASILKKPSGEVESSKQVTSILKKESSETVQSESVKPILKKETLTEKQISSILVHPEMKPLSKQQAGTPILKTSRHFKLEKSKTLGEMPDLPAEAVTETKDTIPWRSNRPMLKKSKTFDAVTDSSEMDSELASVLKVRRAGSEEKEVTKSIDQQEEYSNEEGESSDPTSKLSVAERIFQMQSKIEESSLPVSKLGSGSMGTPRMKIVSSRSMPTSPGVYDSVLKTHEPLVTTEEENLLAKLTDVAEAEEQALERRKRFKKNRDSFRRRTQPITLDEVTEANALDSVSSFRSEVLRHASLNIFKNQSEDSVNKPKGQVKKQKGQEIFPQPQSLKKDRFKERRKGNLGRYKSLPELNQIDESEILSSFTDFTKKSEDQPADEVVPTDIVKQTRSLFRQPNCIPAIRIEPQKPPPIQPSDNVGFSKTLLSSQSNVASSLSPIPESADQKVLGGEKGDRKTPPQQVLDEEDEGLSSDSDDFDKLVAINAKTLIVTKSASTSKCDQLMSMSDSVEQSVDSILESLSGCSSPEDEMSKMSVLQKMSKFRSLEEKKQQEVEAEVEHIKTPKMQRRMMNRKERMERSQTQPITEDELSSASIFAKSQKAEQEPSVVATEEVTSEDEKSNLSLSEKMALFSGSKQRAVEETVEPPKRAVQTKRKTRKFQSRFKTQPVTSADLEKASRVSPLAMSMVKPPDPKLLQGLSIREQRELMAQNAEMTLTGGGGEGHSGGLRSYSLEEVNKPKGILKTPNKEQEKTDTNESELKGILKNNSTAITTDKTNTQSGQINQQKRLNADLTSEIKGILKHKQNSLDSGSNTAIKGILKSEHEVSNVDGVNAAVKQPESILKSSSFDNNVNANVSSSNKVEDEDILLGSSSDYNTCSESELQGGSHSINRDLEIHESSSAEDNAIVNNIRGGDNRISKNGEISNTNIIQDSERLKQLDVQMVHENNIKNVDDDEDRLKHLDIKMVQEPVEDKIKVNNMVKEPVRSTTTLRLSCSDTSDVESEHNVIKVVSAAGRQASPEKTVLIKRVSSLVDEPIIESSQVNMVESSKSVNNTVHTISSLNNHQKSSNNGDINVSNTSNANNAEDAIPNATRIEEKRITDNNTTNQPTKTQYISKSVDTPDVTSDLTSKSGTPVGVSGSRPHSGWTDSSTDDESGNRMRRIKNEAVARRRLNRELRKSGER